MSPKAQKPTAAQASPAPVTPENAEVKAAGEAERRRLMLAKGRNTTYQVNPMAGGQFTNMLKTRTGD